MRKTRITDLWAEKGVSDLQNMEFYSLDLSDQEQVEVWAQLKNVNQAHNFMQLRFELSPFGVGI
jgi:hypothetical protein